MYIYVLCFGLAWQDKSDVALKAVDSLRFDNGWTELDLVEEGQADGLNEKEAKKVPKRIRTKKNQGAVLQHNTLISWENLGRGEDLNLRPCRVKARFSNQHKRYATISLTISVIIGKYRFTLEQYFGVKSDAKMTPSIARRILGIRPDHFFCRQQSDPFLPRS